MLEGEHLPWRMVFRARSSGQLKDIEEHQAPVLLELWACHLSYGLDP